MVNLKRKTSFYLLSILVFIFILNPMIINAQGSRVFDDANLFSNEEAAELENEADALSQSYNMDIVIVTTDNAQGKPSRDYADDYYDNNSFGQGENADGILFLIDMDNREPYISTSGEGIKYLTDKRLEAIIDRVFDNGLVDGDYYSASKVFLNDTREYLEMGIPDNQYSEDESKSEPNTLTFLEGIISLMSGGAASALFFLRTKSKYKMKNPVKPLTFRDNSVVSLSSKKEVLLDTVVSHRKMPKASVDSDSGKSTTHTSSDGKTHGGGGSGGRKF